MHYEGNQIELSLPDQPGLVSQLVIGKPDIQPPQVRILK